MAHTHQTTLNCRGRLLDLSRPIVMGILNVTPDSFFDGGRFNDPDTAVRQAEKMLAEGAALLDIGGASSRPGAAEVPVEEEKRRVLPAIEAILKRFPEAILSVDTWRPEVAQAAVELGVGMVNDVSGGKAAPSRPPHPPSIRSGQAPQKGGAVADTGATSAAVAKEGQDAQSNVVQSTEYSTAPPFWGGQGGGSYVLMHTQGTPATMQQNPQYEDIVREVLDFFLLEISRLRALGLTDIVLDPGFGFGKTVEHNYTLLKNLHVFGAVTGLPVLAGISRKSMICKVLKVNPDKALNGTTALHMVALQQGAAILRAHDVREAAETIKLWEALQ